MLAEKIETLKLKKNYKTRCGTVHRVFELHKECERHLDGTLPAFIIPEMHVKKRLN